MHGRAAKRAMLFNSIGFLYFFPAVTLAYFALPHRLRAPLLLAASIWFYAVLIPAYLLVLGALILIDYTAALWIERVRGSRRRWLLGLSILSTCTVLFMFKYFDFFNMNLRAVAGWLHWNYPLKALALVLPVGLSFHTFQSLSYVIEVYRGRQKAEHRLDRYALYVMFYPQLVAGPIERPQHLLPQFDEVHRFDGRRVADGLARMAWGMFQKVVIADRIAMMIAPIYASPQSFEGVSFLVAAGLFTIQVYCDFNGYSDIAIGAARVMGFRLVENFNRPFFAESLAELWRRWHMSLMSWFRDYVYFPMVRRRSTEAWRFLGVMTVFLMSGFWHGAHWHYIAWGGLNGLALLLGRATQRLRKTFWEKWVGVSPALRKPFRIATTFLLFSAGNVFFRAQSVADAAYMLAGIPGGVLRFGRSLVYAAGRLNQGHGLLRPLMLGQHRDEVLAAAASILLLFWMDRERGRPGGGLFGPDRPWHERWTLYYIVMLGIVFLGAFDTARQFVYFQF